MDATEAETGRSGVLETAGTRGCTVGEHRDESRSSMVSDGVVVLPARRGARSVESASSLARRPCSSDVNGCVGTEVGPAEHS